MTDHDPGTVFRPGQHNLPQPRPTQHWPPPVYRQPQPPPGPHPYVVHHVHHTPVPTKDVGVAFLLWFFLGGFGADQFYLNRTGPAVGIVTLNALGLCTLCLGGLGLIFLGAVLVWLLVDAFLIPGWVREHNARSVYGVR